ncbi:MAG: protein-L-isoaspartate O-methyltransferase [Hyphomicrobiaceae bacterium]|nr:protein-L-isoaspartate O-methyltransferase [Hyphomicrobiaceae bacterium]
MTDSAAQRLNMVESQVRPSDVTDRRIIRAMLAVPREAFVPDALRSIAYMDVDVPVLPGASAPRYLLAPRLFAKLAQEARLEAGMSVLDVGCATGYSSAVLARFVGAVTGLECVPELAAAARKALAAQGAGNVTVVEGPLEAGVSGSGPFDAILLNGAVGREPGALLEQLKEGGRLLCVVADGYFGQAVVFTRVGRTFDRRTAFDAGAHPLPGFAAKAEFVF